ncbi:MAG: twin-arginine translocation pathway signal protein [Gemmatimonadetes bacterium]|nr:twin-arginine translocation pathway signal protein [Gemmatimonadota bacterium]
MHDHSRIDRRMLLKFLCLAPGAGVGWLTAAGARTDRDVKGELERWSRGGAFLPRWRTTDGPACSPTERDVQGPFYVAGAPGRARIAGPDEPGDRIVVRGTVLSADCKTPVANALVDVWQADAEGRYHEAEDDYRLRGVVRTDARGGYVFETIAPGRYRIDENAGSLRPAHIHFTVASARHRPLTTQLYFKGDPYLAPNDACGDACGSDDPGRIVEATRESRDGTGFSATFNIVLAALSAEPGEDSRT